MAKELQVLVNQEARATTGCFCTTNHGALAMEAGLRPAVAQLENRQRRFALRLLSLPEGEQAREVVGTNTAIGRRLGSVLKYTWTETEKTVLLEEQQTFDAELIQEEWEEAKKEAEKGRPGLVMFTDGSRWKVELPDMRWHGRTANPGRVLRPIWGITRRPLMRSVRP